VNIRFSDEHGASKAVQKMSIELLEYVNEFASYINKVNGKPGVTKHYEKNKESYDLAVKKLLKAKELMLEATGDLLGKGEFHVK